MHSFMQTDVLAVREGEREEVYTASIWPITGLQYQRPTQFCEIWGQSAERDCNTAS